MRNVRISFETPPALTSVQFDVTSDRSIPEGGLPIQLGFALARFSENVFRMDLTVSAKDAGPASFKVTYGAVFRILLAEGETCDAAEYDNVVRNVLVYSAPSVLYPYIRETVSSLFSRAGLGPIALPLINFRQVVDPAQVKVPPVPDDPEPTEESSKSEPDSSG